MRQLQRRWLLKLATCEGGLLQHHRLEFSYIKTSIENSLSIIDHQLLLLLESSMGTRLLLGLVAVLLAASFCCCSSAESNTERSVIVLGKSHCIDCAEKKVKTEHAYEGTDASKYTCLALCFYSLLVATYQLIN